jgi:ABC-type nitrate/sulfonate/bicarbonate transport system substrate-binding protein
VAATQAPLWAAKEGGYFASNGIEPDITLIRDSSTAAAALLSQNVDLVEMSGPGTVNASSQGADLVMIAGFVNIATYKLMADAKHQDR